MKRYYHLYTLLAVVLLCGISLSCDETNPWGNTPPAEVPANGTVDFGIQLGSDSIDISAPITIDRPSDTLSITIGQQSSYTDPDGTVYTCEPRATITLYSLADTIHAEDIAALTTVAGATATTEQSGSNPVLHTAKQMFTIGGQELALDLGYEVYTYTNSQSSTVEMPYIRTGAATEPTVSLCSLSLTRASIVDSTLFEVSAKFNLELESVNTKNENKDTLEFNVRYIGVVETITELYGSVAYTINDKEGESASPFVINGADSLLLEIKERSTYAAADTAVYSFSPMASIRLKVKSDTAFVEKYELLSTLVEMEEPEVATQGENPVANLRSQLFATSSQEFLFETMYEVYTAQSGDEMPYLMIGEPKCIGIEVIEQKKDATTRGFVYDTVYYDVKAKFEVELKGVNVSDELLNTLEFEVNYVGGVINATEVVELVNITYRKNQVFYEGHDNLWPRSQCEVYRDRHYSDGHVETDEFYGVPWFWFETNASSLVFVPIAGEDIDYDGIDTTVVFSPNLTLYYGDVTDSKNIRYNHLEIYSNVEVPDMDFFQYVEKDGWFEGDTLLEYGPMYERELMHEPFDFDNPIEGWYMKVYYRMRKMNLKYVRNGENINFRHVNMFACYYDRFFCIDDTIIGFEEYRPNFIWTDKIEDFEGNETKGPGKIFKFEVNAQYLGQPVHVAVIDTLYTPKGTIVEKDDRNISVTLDAPTDIAYASATLHARVVGHEGEVFPQYGFYVQLPYTGEWRFYKADSVAADGSYFSATVNELEIVKTHQYYAQIGGPFSCILITSDTQTFTTKHTNISTDEAVDLGLSVKWASHNLGATNIQGKGTTFHQWPATDVVESQWGKGWRLPTAKEAEELISHCHQAWGSYQGRVGFLLVADNGNAIFLPAVGRDFFVVNPGFECIYLTSTEYTLWDGADGYTTLQAYKGGELGLGYDRKEDASLCPIRPVRE